jgi:hypothetical protein
MATLTGVDRRTGLGAIIPEAVATGHPLQGAIQKFRT